MGLMVVSPKLDRTLVFDSSVNEISIVVSSTETNACVVTLPDFTESIIAKDTNTGICRASQYFRHRRGEFGVGWWSWTLSMRILRRSISTA